MRRYAGRGKFGVSPREQRTYDGVVYPSKAEAAYAAELDLRKRAGDIVDWHRAESFPLNVNGFLVGSYRPDFHVLERPAEATLWVEVKGAWSEAARLRVRLFRACYPNLRLVCIRRAWGKFSPEPLPQLKPSRSAQPALML